MAKNIGNILLGSKKNKPNWGMLITVLLVGLAVTSGYKYVIEPRMVKWLAEKGIASSTVTGMDDGSVLLGDLTPTEQKISLESEDCFGGTQITLAWNDEDIQLKNTDPGTDLRILTTDERVADDGTTNLATKTTFTALAGNGSNSYYAKYIEFTTGCSRETLKVALPDAGSLTVTAVNDDGRTTNSVSNRQAIGASDCREMEIDYDVSSNDYWGNPNIVDADGKIKHENVAVAQYDASDLTSIEVIDASTGSKPQQFAYGTIINSGYDSDETYKVETLEDGKRKTIVVEACSGSSDPGNGNFTLNFYDANLDVDEETDEIISGVNDEDNNPLFLAGANVTVHYS
ncbi:MAG: hypothetical protein ACFFG0_06055 [Candidatus Thorarchaeota archaeon]